MSRNPERRFEPKFEEPEQTEKETDYSKYSTEKLLELLDYSDDGRGTLREQLLSEEREKVKEELRRRTSQEKE